MTDATKAGPAADRPGHPEDLMNTEDMTIRHVILDRPLRCWAQMMTAITLAETHGATLHLTPGCYGERSRKRPGMGSGCMPLDPKRGFDRCRHDLTGLRREGAIDITANIECHTFGEPLCQTCGGKGRADGLIAMPDEYPASHLETAPLDTLW